MLGQTVGFFVSWLASPSILGIGLAVVFGAIWLAGYWPPLFKKYWLWAVFVSSAILTLVAVAFIQIPLQFWARKVITYLWGQQTLSPWLPLTRMPLILVSGFVQEGAKLVPVVAYWYHKEKNIDPKLGLAIGAVAGAGFGVFEAQWGHNIMFTAGWSWEAVQTGGLIELARFWEIFFVVAAHIAFSALVGWGLAKGWGWEFYILASFLHTFLNYSAVLFGLGLMTLVQAEIFIAVVAVLVTGGALWLRWRKPAVVAESTSET